MHSPFQLCVSVVSVGENYLSFENRLNSCERAMVNSDARQLLTFDLWLLSSDAGDQLFPDGLNTHYGIIKPGLTVEVQKPFALVMRTLNWNAVLELIEGGMDGNYWNQVVGSPARSSSKVLMSWKR